MYYLLLELNNVVINVSGEKPILTEEEENLFVWRFSDGSGIMNQGYTCIEVEDIPDGMLPNKYCYNQGEFTVNPNYREPVITLQQYDELYLVTKMLKETVNGQCNRTIESELELEYRLSLIELGLV